MRIFYTLPHAEIPTQEQFLVFAEDEEQAEHELEKSFVKWGLPVPRFYPPQFVEVLGTGPGVLRICMMVEDPV